MSDRLEEIKAEVASLGTPLSIIHFRMGQVDWLIAEVERLRGIEVSLRNLIEFYEETAKGEPE